MRTITAFIKRHAVLTYYALVFAISWGGVLVVVGPTGFPGTSAQVERLMPLVILAFLVGPALGGPVLTGLVYGRAGLRQFLSRLLKWRVAARWYAVALLTAPLLMMAVLLALSLFSREFVPGIFTSNDRATLLLVGIATAVGAGFFEELGWTGFVIPELKRHYGVIRYGTHRRRAVGRVALACLRLDQRHGFRGALPRWLPARCFPIPDALQGAHGVGVRPHWEPARGDVHARESHSQCPDPYASGDSRRAPLDL